MQFLNRWAMVALSVVMCCASPIVQAAPGDLDPTFGVNGLATTPSVAVYLNVTIQPDGKFVAMGEGGGGYSAAPFLVRYNSDGSLDSSFGSGGIVQTNPTDAWTPAVAVEADGKILTAIWSSVVRYSATGILEATFDSSLHGFQGCTTTGGCITAIVIQPDGKILAATGAGVVRYNSDGTYDTGFGNNGIAPIGLRYRDMVLQSDGKIVACTALVTCTGPGCVYPDTIIVRYNSDGTPDPTFGSGNGIVAIPRDYNNGAYQVSVQTDGKIIFVSNDYTRPVPPYRASVLTRLNTDGSLDSSFGSSGIVETPIGNNAFANAVRLQSDGKIVVSGDDQGIFVARYNTDGSPDTQFGTGGIVTTGPGGSGLAIAFQSDGKIVVAGSWGDSMGNGGATVARYMVDNTPINNTPVGNGVNVNLDFGTVAFSSVTTAGNTTMTESSTGPVPPAGFQTGEPPLFYDIQTTAVFNPPVDVCIDYDPAGYADPSLAQLFHYEGGAWTDVTTSNDTVNGIICGQVSSLSPFAIFEPAGGYAALIQSPIDADGSSVFKANRGVVPVKFSLSLGGLSTCTLPPATIAVFRTGGTTNQPVSEAEYSSAADGGSNYRITGCEYHYNLNAKSLGQGTYLVQILINNSVVGSANFGLK